ncbi:hypothetical protein [Embleya sp. NPDC020630]|uniref:hypothetical protein n=1 Tax=Embleya sp. NPDC020630 TaxID=3363979 RepID=UPI00378E5B7C
MDDLTARLQKAARDHDRAKTAYEKARVELRDLLREARAEGKGPSELARITGYTREWVALLAPKS